MEAPLLSGIVVHWRNEALLAELAAAWPADPRFELVVVDNASSGELALGGARRITPAGNLGFAGGANAGVAAARAPLVLLLNPDAVPEPGALEALVAGFAALPDAAGLAPRLLGPGGEPQWRWQLRRLPKPWEAALQGLFLPLPRPLAAEPPAGAAIPQPAAAALALRRSALEQVGGLDAGFFPAWFEDVDLARRLAAAGLALRYWPAARFRHRLGSTVATLGYGPFLWIYGRNLARYLGKHHGRAWAGAARVTLALGAALRIAALPLRRPARARSRAAAARGLATALAGALSGWRRPRALAAQAAPPALAAETGRSAGERSQARVAVCIVTHGSAADLPGCLAAVAALDHRPLELVIADCASADGSLEVARRHAPAGIPFHPLALADNRGFAGGMNAALAATAAPVVLTLNADARPEPAYVSRLLTRLETAGARAGAATGRLIRLDGRGGVDPAHPADGPGPRRQPLDACGMRLTPSWRHLDRGSGEPDRGQYARPERVFGATGAASLFRREALADVAWGGPSGEVFDPLFHSFREDAELAFRLCERGWAVLYEPAAVASHRRFNLPERRGAMPPAVNFHSLKNRYLLRLYHQTPRNFLLTLPPTLLRDAMALAYVLLRERSSLAAYAWLWRHRRTIASRRREVAARRTAPAAALDRWFFRGGEPL